MVTRKLIDIKPIEEQLMQAVTEKTKNLLSISGDTVTISVTVKDLIDKYLEDKGTSEPRLYITTDAFVKMRTLINKYDKEIGMYGTVEKVHTDTDCYVITDILVYPQKTSGATCEQDEDRMWEFEMSLTTEQVNQRRFHIHSHVNMSTGPSGVDEDFYQRLMVQVEDFYIVGITNKRNEYFTRFYDVTNNIIYENLPIYVIKGNGESIDDWYDKQIKDNVTEKVYASVPAYSKESKMPKQNTGYYKQYSYNDYDDDDWWERHESIAKAYKESGKKRGRPKKY